MPVAEPRPGRPPCAGCRTGEGASVDGLRLLGGGLAVRIAHGGAAVFVRLRDAPQLPADAGIPVSRPFGLRMPRPMRRMADFRSVAGRAGPRNGREGRR